MTGQELATRVANSELAISGERLELLKRTIAVGATDDEFALFVQVCNRTGLDPFARQIFLVGRYDAEVGQNVKRPEVSIDGARLIAKRAKSRGGASYRPGRTYYYDEAGKEYTVWVGKEPPAAARVTVFVDGVEAPGIPVRWDERVQTKRDGSVRSNWKKMPATMLGKCAEMATLRQAFPHELSGLYIEEELEPARTLETVVSEELATPEQLDALEVLIDQLASGDVGRDAIDGRLQERYGTAELEKLTTAQAAELLELLNKPEAE